MTADVTALVERLTWAIDNMAPNRLLLEDVRAALDSLTKERDEALNSLNVLKHRRALVARAEAAESALAERTRERDELDKAGRQLFVDYGLSQRNLASARAQLASAEQRTLEAIQLPEIQLGDQLLLMGVEGKSVYLHTVTDPVMWDRPETVDHCLQWFRNGVVIWRREGKP